MPVEAFANLDDAEGDDEAAEVKDLMEKNAVRNAAPP